MALDPADLAAATTLLARELAALDACGPDWTTADQVRYVRALLEDGIDELARADDAHYDYVADCVVLAAQNMQDARLDLIEDRLQAIEQPGPPTVANLVIDTAIVLGAELAVVVGAEVAVPALIALAAARLRSRTTRQLTAVAAAPVPDDDLLLRLAATVADRQANLDTVRRFAELAPGGLTQSGEHAALIELATARHVLRVAEAAAATGQPVLDRVATALVAPDPAPTKSAQLAAFAAGVVRHTTVNRVAENGAVALDDLLDTAGGPPGRRRRAEVFLTSTYAGAVLSQVRREQEWAARDWRRLRFAVRALPDAALLASPLMQELCLRIRLFTLDPVVESGLAASREGLVLGMETQLWLAWLLRLNALASALTGDFHAVRQRGPDIRPGMVHEDKHVHEAELDVQPGGLVAFRCRGAAYPGIGRISDPMADFLYFRYAHHYFLRHPDAAPSPLVFDPARYEEVPRMRPRTPLGLDDVDRSDRIAEMKLLVIVFFQIAAADPAGQPGGSDAAPFRAALLGLVPGADPVGDYLDSLPPVSEPDPPPAAAPPGADPDLAALARAAVDPRAMAETSVVLLGTLVTDLEVALLTFPAAGQSFDDSAQGQADRAARTDLAAQIEALLDAVPRQRDVVETLTADFPDLRDRARAQDPRIARLTAAWTGVGFQLP